MANFQQNMLGGVPGGAAMRTQQTMQAKGYQPSQSSPQGGQPMAPAPPGGSSMGQAQSGAQQNGFPSQNGMQQLPQQSQVPQQQPGGGLEQQALNGGGVDNKQQISNFMTALNRVGAGSNNSFSSGPAQQAPQQFAPLVTLPNGQQAPQQGPATTATQQTTGNQEIQAQNQPGIRSFAQYVQNNTMAYVPGYASAGTVGTAADATAAMHQGAVNYGPQDNQAPTAPMTNIPGFASAGTTGVAADATTAMHQGAESFAPPDAITAAPASPLLAADTSFAPGVTGQGQSAGSQGAMSFAPMTTVAPRTGLKPGVTGQAQTAGSQGVTSYAPPPPPPPPTLTPYGGQRGGSMMVMSDKEAKEKAHDEGYEKGLKVAQHAGMTLPESIIPAGPGLMKGNAFPVPGDPRHGWSGDPTAPGGGALAMANAPGMPAAAVQVPRDAAGAPLPPSAEHLARLQPAPAGMGVNPYSQMNMSQLPQPAQPPPQASIPPPAVSSDEDRKDVNGDARGALQDFMGQIGAHNYTYKNPERDGQGTFTSPMAQELERTKLGKQAVVETQNGKMVDYGRLGGVNLAALSVVHREQERLKSQVQALRGAMRKGRSDG